MIVKEFQLSSTSTNYESRITLIFYWGCRLFLGVLVLATGVGKALDLPGFIGVMRTYELGLPEWALWISGTAVTLFELALGAWILYGWELRSAALLAALMNLGYMLLLTVALLRGLELQNCGCYGVFLARPLRWYTPLEDLLLIAVSGALFYLSDRRSQSQGMCDRDHFKKKTCAVNRLKSAFRFPLLVSAV